MLAVLKASWNKFVLFSVPLDGLFEELVYEEMCFLFCCVVTFVCLFVVVFLPIQ